MRHHGITSSSFEALVLYLMKIETFGSMIRREMEGEITKYGEFSPSD